MEKSLHNIRAVAFDLDGTLVDSMPDLAAAANTMLPLLGRPTLAMAKVQSYVGDGIGNLVRRALAQGAAQEVPDEEFQRGLQIFLEVYAVHCADKTVPYPGVVDGLALLRRRGLPLAVVTNKHSALAVKILEVLGLAGEFSLILGADSLPERKPSPLPLLHVCEALGIVPHELAMVGDSHNDMLAAHAAGAFAIAVGYGYENPHTLAAQPQTRPDWVIDAITAIAEALEHPPAGQPV